MELLSTWVPQCRPKTFVGCWSRRGPLDIALCDTCRTRLGQCVGNAVFCERGGIVRAAPSYKVVRELSEDRHEIENRGNAVFRTDQQGCVPSVQSYIHWLQACTKNKDLAEATLLHAHICRNGLELNSILGELIVCMLVECGSMADAVLLFNRLVTRTDLSWTALIAGYSRSHQGQEAFGLYSQMQREGVQPNKYTFISLLKVCGSLSDLGQGQWVHAEIVRHGCEASLFVRTALLNMYARCGSMVDALSLFEAMSYRDVVVWNTMLAGYAQQEEGEKALDVYAKMQDEGVRPDECTFVSVLKACGLLADLERHTFVDGKSFKAVCFKNVREIHAEFVRIGHESNAFVASTLIHVYTICGSNLDAQHVFDALSNHEVAVWSALIAGYAQEEHGQMALHLFAQMQEEGVRPNGKTFVSVLNACGSLGSSEEMTSLNGYCVKPEALQKGQVLHAEAVRMHHDGDVFVANTLIDMYCKCGSTLDARHVFDKLCNHNVVSWNAMIAGYALQDQGEMALQLYAKMQDDPVKPNQRTYVSILKACVSCAAMEDSSFGLSVKPSSLARIKAIHSAITRANHAPDMFLTMTLIQVYSLCGSTEDGKYVFDNTSLQSEVGIWTAMIASYCQHEEPEEALQLFHQMQQKGMKPSEVTLLSILKACGNTGALATCRQIHQEHIKECQWSPRVANTLIHVYGKCGSMHDARIAFDALLQHDVVSWSALIAGYARHGEYGMSLKCFDEMQRAGIQPNSVTFVSLLATCSHAGLVDRGVHYFQSMRDYGITPKPEHYVSMVDILGRAGLLSMAEDLLSEMPMQPDHRVWLSLLGACRKHVNVELGGRAFQCAIRLDPKHGAAYVLMSSIYAHAQMLNEGKDIEDLRVQAGAWKKKAQCWIEHKMKLHTFVVNDSSHQQSLHVYAMVRELNSLLEKWSTGLSIQKPSCF